METGGLQLTEQETVERARKLHDRFGEIDLIQNPVNELLTSNAKLSEIVKENWLLQAKMFLYAVVKLWKKLKVPNPIIMDILEEARLDELEEVNPYPFIQKDKKNNKIYKVYIDVVKTSEFPMGKYNTGYDREDPEYLVWGRPFIQLLQDFANFYRDVFGHSAKMQKYCKKKPIHEGVSFGENMYDIHLRYAHSKDWKVCLNFSELDLNETEK